MATFAFPPTPFLGATAAFLPAFLEGACEAEINQDMANPQTTPLTIVLYEVVVVECCSGVAVPLLAANGRAIGH